MREDVKNVFTKDPAARSVIEVLTCYPGLHAVWLHRIAHWLWTHGFLLLGRLTSHFARHLTGIEIHPGATIGRRFFIDHGMGVVIGETTEIGEDCLLYQGVVLGGTTLEKKKRHPTLGNGVVVGTGAIVLGAITLGDRSRVGAGSVVVNPVPADTSVVGVPARPTGGAKAGTLEHGKISDPVNAAIALILAENECMRKRIEEIETKQGVAAHADPGLAAKHAEIAKQFEEKRKEN
jgi:serine O-acetyltransferase